MNTEKTESKEIKHDLGTFEGFNFKHQCGIFQRLTASDVVNWDHDLKGEAEFWSSGDRKEISIIFGRQEVFAQQLLDLDRVLTEMGGDSKENCLRVYYAVQFLGEKLADLTSDRIQDHDVNIFWGTCFSELRKEAAFQLFELYYPEEYAVWQKSRCDGLNFDVDRFLDSPSFHTDEISLNDECALIVVPD